jgi:hypothetical protein
MEEGRLHLWTISARGVLGGDRLAVRDARGKLLAHARERGAVGAMLTLARSTAEPLAMQRQRVLDVDAPAEGEPTVERVDYTLRGRVRVEGVPLGWCATRDAMLVATKDTLALHVPREDRMPELIAARAEGGVRGVGRMPCGSFFAWGELGLVLLDATLAIAEHVVREVVQGAAVTERVIAALVHEQVLFVDRATGERRWVQVPGASHLTAVGERLLASGGLALHVLDLGQLGVSSWGDVGARLTPMEGELFAAPACGGTARVHALSDGEPVQMGWYARWPLMAHALRLAGDLIVVRDDAQALDVYARR